MEPREHGQHGHDPLMGSGGQRLDTEVGYGLPIGSRFVGTPRAGLRTSEYGRDYRIGYDIQVLEQGRLNLAFGVDAERRESPLFQMQEQGTDTDQRVLRRATVQWSRGRGNPLKTTDLPRTGRRQAEGHSRGPVQGSPQRVAVVSRCDDRACGRPTQVHTRMEVVDFRYRGCRLRERVRRYVTPVFCLETSDRAGREGVSST